MPTRAFLYDATATDHSVSLDAQTMTALHDRQLLWVDVGEYSEDELRQVGAFLKLNRESVYNLLQSERRPRLDNYGDYFQLTVSTIQDEDGKYSLVQLQFVVLPNCILTVHKQSVAFLESFDQRVKADSQLGELDAPAFLAALLDWHITSYFRIIEQFEAAVDKIDAHALRARHTRDLLTELAKLRQRVGFVRQMLTPHREVYAALARPDFQMLSISDSAAHYSLLNDRLNRAIDAVENARELLVSSFDIFTTQTTLRTNEVMKVLTLASFIWFPASVIVSIAAMLLRTPVDALHTRGFWVMTFAIVGIGIFTLAAARLRRWI